MSTFKERVLKIVRNIPKGSVLSYKEVARRAGNSRAARAVGTIMKQNIDTRVPCHRVIKTDGTFGPYNGLQGKSKEEVLVREGYVHKRTTS